MIKNLSYACHLSLAGYNKHTMSEKEPAAEHEYKEMSGIIKYYHDINTTVRSENDAFMAIVRLVESSPLALPPSPSLLMNTEYMPSEWCIDNDIREAKELLSVLPICYMAPELEKSDVKAEDVLAWYKDALRGARMIIGGDHGIACLKVEHGVHYDNCEKSFVCPHRVIETQLTKGMMLPDFNDEIYSGNPNRAYEINTNKIMLGVEQGILLPGNAETLKVRYELQYEEWTRSRGGRQIRTDPI